MSTSFDEKVAQVKKEWEEIQSTNRVYIRGVIAGEPEKITTEYNTYYQVMVEVMRLSGLKDVLPVLVREELVKENVLSEGNQVEIRGEYRSRNVIRENGNKGLDLFIYAKHISIQEGEEEESQNFIVLEGYTTKTPTLRHTPSGQSISDIMLAVHYGKFNRSNYIPCIAWGSLAHMIDGKPAGTRIKLLGRIQSREYVKKYPDDPQRSDEIKVAYEVSIMNASLD